MIERRWRVGDLGWRCTEAGGVSARHDVRWSRPEKTTELCRASGSRPEIAGIIGGNGRQDCIAGGSTALGGSTARDLGAGATIRAQGLAGEDGSAAELTSGDRKRNPSLMGRGAEGEEI